MLLCGHQQDMEGPVIQTSEEVNWTAAAKQCDNLKEMPSFVAQQRQLDEHVSAKKVSVDPSKLQGKQLEAFKTAEDDSVWNCRNGKVILDLVLARTAGRSTSRECSNWSCGLQCAWTHAALLVEHSCPR